MSGEDELGGAGFGGVPRAEGEVVEGICEGGECELSSGYPRLEHGDATARGSCDAVFDVDDIVVDLDSTVASAVCGGRRG